MSKNYPTIITNERDNSNSANRRITVDEYYDLMHHTHNISDLIVADGVSYSDLVNKMNTMIKTINTYKKIIEGQQKEITNLKSEIQTIKGINDNTVSLINNTQPQEENNLGTLMGFTMTEIKE